MKGLIRNDLLLMKKQCIGFLFIYVIFLAASLFSEHTFLFLNTFLFSIAGGAFLSSCIIDFENGWAFFCSTCPISKKDYVKAKYIFSLIILAFVFAGVILFYIFNPHIKKDGFFKYLFENVLIASVNLIFISIDLIFVFKVKVFINKIIVPLTTGLLAGLGALYSINLMFAEPSVITAFIFMAAASVFYLLSFKISLNSYIRKEF